MPSVRGPSAAPCQSEPPLGTSENARRARASRVVSLGRMARMPHLDAVDARSRRSARCALARAVCDGMREHGQTAGGMNHRDRVGHAELLLRHVRRTTGAEVAIERVAHIDGPTIRDERTCDVRTPDRADARLRQHVVERDLHTELDELVDDLPGAPLAHLAQRLERMLEHSACRTDAGRGGAFPLRPPRR